MLGKNSIYQYLFLFFFAVTSYLLLDKLTSPEEPLTQTANSTQQVQIKAPSSVPAQKEFSSQEIATAFKQKTKEDLIKLEAFFQKKATTSLFSIIENVSIDVKKTDSLLAPYQGFLLVKACLASTENKTKLETNYKFDYSWQDNSWVLEDYTLYLPMYKGTIPAKDSPESPELLAALRKA